MKHTSIRLEESTYNKLLEIAEKEKRSVSNIINLYLEKVLHKDVKEA